MDRQMRFREDHGTRDALRLELVEAFAHTRQTGSGDGIQARSAERLRIDHVRRVGWASVPLAQQMDSVHQSSPQKEKPHPGA